MSDTGTMWRTRGGSEAGGGRVLSIALWVLQVLLAPVFAMAGIVKRFRYVVGALELAGAVGVLIPRLSGLAALGLACVMVGATITNLFVLDASPLPTIGLLAVCALLAWGRRSKTRALLGGR